MLTASSINTPQLEREMRALLPRYQQLRELGKRQHQQLLEKVDPGAPRRCAKRLGIEVDGRTLLLGSESEMTVLFDYCIHDHRPLFPPHAGLSAVDRYLAEYGGGMSEDERAFTASRARSSVSIYVVVHPVSEVGVLVQDLFTGLRIFVHDAGMGTSAKVGQAHALRLVSDGNTHLSTGAGVPVLPSGASRLIQQLQARFDAEELKARESLNGRRRAELSALLLRASLEAGGAELVRYA